MLLEEFDETKKAVINPEHFHKKLDNMPKTCVSFFSKSIMDLIKKQYKPELITNEIATDNTVYPVYKINVDGTEIAIFQSAVGAPVCVANAEELIALGVKNLLLVGPCGCLAEDMEEYSIILPTAAIRDEGTSYHYEEARDETKLNPKVVKILENVMANHKIHYKKGKTWTTDAIFRETPQKVAKRKAQGAITVDMECSAMNVLCKFRHVKFGQIFYALDNLASEEYDPRGIMIKNSNHDSKRKIIELALECGVELDKSL